MKLLLFLAISSLIGVGISITYHSTIICPQMAKSISCPKGQVLRTHRVITRSSFNYAKNDKQLLQRVRGACDTERSCSLPANRLKDVALCTTNFVEVKYSCFYPRRQAYICEGKKKTLTCPKGLVIHDFRGFYGRGNTKKICPKKPILKTHCYARGSGIKMSANCKGEQSCEIHASNSVFGDPCVGTTKYVAVQYACKP